MNKNRISGVVSFLDAKSVQLHPETACVNISHSACDVKSFGMSSSFN